MRSIVKALPVLLLPLVAGGARAEDKPLPAAIAAPD